MWTSAWPLAAPLLLLLLAGRCGAGCREAGLCCPGRDPACLSRGWRADRSYGACYCDQACLSTMDCCHDYSSACPVSEWSPWSDCAEPCRATVRRRSRSVLRERLNGGAPCPHLEEQAGCADYRSQHQHQHQHQHPHCHSALVPALITTGGYGNARKKRQVAGAADVTGGYCVQFQLSSRSRGCGQSSGAHTHWMQQLREGHRVCVECQPPALAAGHTHCAGDGEHNHQEDSRQSLQWQAVGNPQCRGVWRRVGRTEACSCPMARSFLFI